MKKHILLLSVSMILALVLCGAVSADEYLGGQPLSTENGTNGTVSGGVYVEAPQYTTNTNLDEHTFNLPENASDDVQWARLYVTIYALNQQTDYGFCATNEIDGDGDGVYETTWTETDHAPFNFMENGGNDNTAFGGGENDPYKIINDHTTRVTSDYFMWYDVTDMITSDTVKVKVDTTGSPSDGRIKMMTLIVAYNDGDDDQIMYWVNQGHDVTSYKTEENYGTVAVGSTTFATSSITGTVESANLTVNYLASNNGYYGFPSADNDFEYTGGSPPVEGTFTNTELDRTPDAQGAYAGVDSWDVTSYVDGSSDVTLGYSRYFPGTGTSGYFKIPLAILTVNLESETVEAPVAAFTSNTTSGTHPLYVQFTDESTNTPTSWLWDFGDGTTSEDQNPTHTYNTAGTYTVSLTATNDGGSDDEVKTDYITANPNVDLYFSSLVNTVPASAVFAGEPNPVKIVVKNQGTDTATNIVVKLYASDVNGGTTVVNETVIPSLAAGATTTITLVDPTIRAVNASTVYGASDVGHVIYTAVVDPDDLIPETNEANNSRSSASKPVYYNGYKGKGLYEYNGTDINTQHVYDIYGDIVYYTQPDSAYKAVGWTDRTETWNTANLSVPSTGTIEDVLLYLPYNWDHTADGDPNWTIYFNGNDITNSALAWYIDQSNFGAYAEYKYGLMVFNVTNLYNREGDNNLVMTALDGNQVALYPSTLAVIYSDPNETRKQIFISEECDELGLSASSYGTTLEEATTYANFTGMTIDTSKVNTATLVSFAGSAGPDEGNLYFNGNTIALASSPGTAWQGNSNTASALVADVTSYLSATGNYAAIQGTTSGGMDALQQFLIVEYDAELPDLIITGISPNVGAGAEMFANEPNTFTVTVKNNGTVASAATTVNVTIDGETQNLNIPALNPGESTTVTVTNENEYSPTENPEDAIPVSANADPSDNIPEADETNNLFETNIIVYNNGYKGKQYTDDDEYDSQETQETWEGTYDVIYSHGNTAYNGAPWTEKTYTWTSSDLVIPSGASVVSARLYQGYTYNKMGVDPAWTLVFNGNTLTTLATYSDIKGFGSYSNPYGLYVYDVTSFFDAAGNTMTITPEEGVNYGIYGAYLIVVYEDSTTSYKQIFINDGFDMLYSRDSYSVNDTEATAYANFEDVYTTGLENAKTIVVMGSSGPSSADENKSKFLFNGVEYTGFWNDYLTSPQIGFSVYDVTSNIVEGFNTAGMQSYDPTGPGDSTYGDNMYTMTTILVTQFELMVTEVDPADGATDVDQDQQITVTFNENIQAGTNYNGITVRNAATGQGYSLTKSIVGNQLFLTGKWTPGVTFQIVIPKNSIQDLNGNQITDTYTSTFTASEGPSITSFDPTNGATNVATDKQIVITFSEDIQAGTNYHAITVRNAATGQGYSLTKNIVGNQLFISGNWTPGTVFEIVIPKNSVQDLDGNSNANIYTSTFTAAS